MCNPASGVCTLQTLVCPTSHILPDTYVLDTNMQTPTSLKVLSYTIDINIHAPTPTSTQTTPTRTHNKLTIVYC